MNTETISNILRLLTKYPKFKSPEGLLPVVYYECEKDILNLFKARQDYPELKECLEYFDLEYDWDLRAMTWPSNEVPYIIWGDPEETEIDTEDFDLWSISEYIRKAPEEVQEALVKLVKVLQNIVIRELLEPKGIYLIDIQGFKLPVEPLRKILGSNPYQGEAPEDHNLDRALLIAQHEILKHHLSI